MDQGIKNFERSGGLTTLKFTRALLVSEPKQETSPNNPLFAYSNQLQWLLLKAELKQSHINKRDNIMKRSNKL